MQRDVIDRVSRDQRGVMSSGKARGIMWERGSGEYSRQKRDFLPTNSANLLWRHGVSDGQSKGQHSFKTRLLLRPHAGPRITMALQKAYTRDGIRCSHVRPEQMSCASSSRKTNWLCWQALPCHDATTSSPWRDELFAADMFADDRPI